MNLSKGSCLFEKNWNREGRARYLNYFKIRFNPIPPGLFEGGAAWRGGGGGGVPAACNSKTINDNKMKLGGVVKDH